MKFEISREALIKPLQLVTGVVERRQTLPVLSNVQLVLEGDTLSLTGTDLEVELVGRVTVAGGGTEGEITVPARKFADICKNLPENASIPVSEQENAADIGACDGIPDFPLSDCSATRSWSAVAQYAISDPTPSPVDGDQPSNHLEQTFRRLGRSDVRTLAT